jgi:hypothetical protein
VAANVRLDRGASAFNLFLLRAFSYAFNITHFTNGFGIADLMPFFCL